MIAARSLWAMLGLTVLFVAVLGFALPSVTRGFAALGGDHEAMGRFAGTRLSDLGLFSHMIAGGIISLLAFVQWAGPLRRRWPVAHRMSGRLLVPLAFLTALGGLTYIALRGTIGGPLMSAGFALYGLLMAGAAVQTLRFAMAGAVTRHQRWGTRLIILCLGSWLYRVHYGLWYGGTCAISDTLCGIGSQEDFQGLFDQVQVFAFYLPYLLIAELIMRRNA